MVNIGVILIKSVKLFPWVACRRGGYIEKNEDDDSKPKENGNGNGNGEGGNGNGGGSISEGKSGDNSLRDWFGKSKYSDGTPGWVQLGSKYSGKQTKARTNHKTQVWIF